MKITINEKEVTLRFGMLCIEEFSKRVFLSKKSPTGVFGTSAMIFSGAINFYDVKELELPVTFEEVYGFVENNWFNEEQAKVFVEVSKEFTESNSFKEFVKSTNPKEDKKKVQKKS